MTTLRKHQVQIFLSYVVNVFLSFQNIENQGGGGSVRGGRSVENYPDRVDLPADHKKKFILMPESPQLMATKRDEER